MRLKIKYIITFLMVSVAFISFAHENDLKENEKKVSEPKTEFPNQPAENSKQEVITDNDVESINTFPNHHPLIVHFPIVLLLMAFLFQFLSFFFYKTEFSLATIILLVMGVISAWLASTIFHADPEGLTIKANEIFETHELMALFTRWFSLLALVMKILSHFFLKRNWWIESAISLSLIASGITVSIAGHYGAKLVYLEGIGPLGKHLESNHNEGDEHH